MHNLTKWLKNSRGFQLSIFFALMVQVGYSQPALTSLNLEKAYKLARENYPLIKQKDLIARSSFLTIENIRTAFLPQLSVSGQASYQSDVTSISIPIPGFKFSPLSKDQYKVWGDLNQLIYDGGIIKTQKAIQERSSLVDDQKTEVELYQLKDRINQLYLGVLLLDEQLKQAVLAREDVNLGLKTVQAQVQNGTAFKSAQWVLEAQLLQNDQKVIEIKNSRLALLHVLELFVRQTISENAVLEVPVVKTTLDDTIQRPEILLYGYQDSLWRAQQQLVNAKNTPTLSLFAEGGYGKPGFNMLDNEFALYGIGGIRFNWSISNFYTSKRQQQIIDVNRKINNVQKEVFLFNTRTELVQQQATIKNLKDEMDIDEKIIAVRSKITESAKAQLQNGVINSNDYLREINAEDQTRSLNILHQVQLLQAKINYQTIQGNQ